MALAPDDPQSTLERRTLMHERLAEALLTQANVASNAEVASVRATMANAHASLAVLSQMKQMKLIGHDCSGKDDPQRAGWSSCWMPSAT